MKAILDRSMASSDFLGKLIKTTDWKKKRVSYLKLNSLDVKTYQDRRGRHLTIYPGVENILGDHM